MKIFGYIVIAIVIVLGVTFAILNANMVTIHYYLGARQLPLSLLLVLSFGVGLILGLLLLSFSVIRLKSKVRRLKKHLKMAEAEINNLRAIPVKDEH